MLYFLLASICFWLIVISVLISSCKRLMEEYFLDEKSNFTELLNALDQINARTHEVSQLEAIYRHPSSYNGKDL